MKTTVIFLSVVLLVVLTGGMALAAPPNPKEKGNHGAASLAKKHAVAGVVANKDGSGFDVQAKKGTVHVKVDGNTKYQVKGKESGALADVVNGARVNVSGTREGDDLLAKRVHLIPGLGKFGHAVGEVVAYSAGSSITVKAKKTGQNQEFVVNADTKISLPEGDGGVSVGDQVTVVAKSLDSAGKPIAKGIAVHGQDSD